MNIEAMTYYERFQKIKELADSIFTTTEDYRIAACVSDIRVACNRYEKELAPRRGD